VNLTVAGVCVALGNENDFRELILLLFFSPQPLTGAAGRPANRDGERQQMYRNLCFENVSGPDRGFACIRHE
jgi:hypothetical protein